MPRVVQQREAASAPPANGATTPAATTRAKKAKDDSSAPVTFAQRLAHSDLSIRTANLKRLSSFLHRRTPITDTDLQKIYKGLFYLFWLSDKPLVQQQMAERLAAMQDGMREGRWLDVVRGFWVMIRREWTGIDRLRLDKYMTWVRCMLAHSLRYLAKRHWNEELLQQWMDMMTELPLANNQQQRGLFLHVADIFVTELGRVLAEDGVGEVQWAVVERLLQPFWDVVSTCTDASMVKRVEEEVLEALYQQAAEEEEGRSALHELMTANADKMAEKLFALASDKSTLNKYRTRLYKLRDMWQSLQRKEEAAKQRQSTADSTAAVGKKRKGEDTAEVIKKAKKRKAAGEEAEDEVPMLVELDESGQVKADHAATEKSRRKRVEQVNGSSSQQQQRQVGRPDKAVENVSVFADAAEFEVPDFGHDEAADEEEEEEEEGFEAVADEDEDDMAAILRAEEEIEDGDDSFVQEDEADNESRSADGQDGEDGEDDEDGEGEMEDGMDIAVDDDSLFMDSDAFERAIAQDETADRRREGKAAKQSAAAQSASKAAGVKHTALGAAATIAGRTAGGTKQTNGTTAANGHAKGKKQKQQQQKVEEREDGEDVDEVEAERQAEAEMEQQQPHKPKRKQHQRAAAEAEAALVNRGQQNGKRNGKKAASQDGEEGITERLEQQSTPQNKIKKKQKTRSEEEDRTTAQQQTSVDEEKSQSSASLSPSSASTTPRQRNKGRSSELTKAGVPASLHHTTTSSTTTVVTTASSCTPPATSSPSTPPTSHTPKRVSISLEHNRVQQFHHWKPLQVKSVDTPLSSGRTAPKSALKRASMGGTGSDGGEPAAGGKKALGRGRARMSLPVTLGGGTAGAAGRPIGSPRRPTAADFF